MLELSSGSGVGAYKDEDTSDSSSVSKGFHSSDGSIVDILLYHSFNKSQFKRYTNDWMILYEIR
ncbi:hypothetical protein J6590_090194 [Homalodisca vitripennis]|nr:hypothetical protein J6590_090194 [Homalodisca vitripennis]